MSLDNYLSKVILMFVGAAAAIVGIAGGFYTCYQMVTLIGAS